jgi:hypothetical protein
MSTPKFRPTQKDRDVVAALAACGVSHDRIKRRVINPNTGKHISKVTLHKFFKEELTQGLIDANAMVASRLFETAMGRGRGALVAQIFWLKTKAGWRETNRVEHSVETKKVEEMTDDELLRIARQGSDGITETTPSA